MTTLPFFGILLHEPMGRTFAIFGMSVPIFWVAPMLSFLLAYQPTQGVLLGLHILPKGTRIFPIDGYVRLGDNPGQWVHHLLLPWLAAVSAVTVNQAALASMPVRPGRSDSPRRSKPC